MAEGYNCIIIGNIAWQRWKQQDCTQNLERTESRERHETAEHHQRSQERSPRELGMLMFMQWIEFLFNWASDVQTAIRHHLQGLDE